MIDYLADAYSDIAARLRELTAGDAVMAVKYGVWYGGSVVAPGWCHIGPDGRWSITRDVEEKPVTLFDTVEAGVVAIGRKEEGRFSPDDMSVKEYPA